MRKQYPIIQANEPPANLIAMAGVATIEAAATVEGEAPKLPTIKMSAYDGGLLRIAGYRFPVVVDLKGLHIKASNPVYREHDRSKIIGHGTATTDGKTLSLDGVVSGVGIDAQEVVALAKNNYPFEASLGAQPIRMREVEPNVTVEVNGRKISGPFTLAVESELMEISVVDSAASKKTVTKIAATQTFDEKGSDMFSQWLLAKGFDEATLTDAQKASLKAAYDAEQALINASGNTGNNTNIDEVILNARSREERRREYGRIIASAIERGMDSDTAERLVEAASRDNLTPTDFELNVLRCQRHQGSSGRAPSSGQESPELIEAAIARSSGEREIIAGYSEQVLEASERRFRHGLSIVDLLIMAAAANGERDVSRRDVRGLLQAAFQPVRARGNSTYDVGGILSNVANKSIMAGFLSVEDAWRKIVAIKPVNDLKEHDSYSLTGDFTYKKVGAGGELKHAELGEVKYSNRAETYGRLFAITRTDILNDDLGAFGRVRTLLGRGSSLAMAKVIWTEFLSNPAFWSAGAPRNNLLTGAASALDVDSLSNACTLFESQTDPAGDPLGLTPKILLVPSSLKIQAGRLTKDLEIRIDGAAAKTVFTTSNPHAGRFEAVSSQYLSNAKIPNNSNTAWFLLADPADCPTLEVAALFGRLEPVIEEAQGDFDTLSIQMRGYADFGAALVEYRGSVKSQGQ